MIIDANLTVQLHDSEPPNPVTGMMYYDRATHLAMVFDGQQWIAIDAVPPMKTPPAFSIVGSVEIDDGHRWYEITMFSDRRHDVWRWLKTNGDSSTYYREAGQDVFAEIRDDLMILLQLAFPK